MGLSLPLLYQVQSASLQVDASNGEKAFTIPRPNDSAPALAEETFGLDYPVSMPYPAADLNKLTFPDVKAGATEHTQGHVTLALDSTLAVAGISIAKIEMLAGVLGQTRVLWDDAGSNAVVGNSTTLLPKLFDRLPIQGIEQVKVTLRNTTGGNLTGRIIARYELNIAEERIPAQA